MADSPSSTSPSREKRRPTICLDFDGVVHLYSKGWKGPAEIYDPPVPGAAEAISNLRDSGFNVVIFSTRASTEAGWIAMIDWFTKYQICIDDIVKEKPPAMVYVDDRALRFEGDWGETLKTIAKHEAGGFKTWQTKEK
jgi:hypothetical protein